MKNSHNKNSIRDFDLYKLLRIIGIAFSSLMVSLFPVFMTNRYFNIRHDRLYLFYTLSSIMALAVLVSFLFFDNRTKEQRLKARVKLKDLSVTDFAVIAFVLSATVSTVLSNYPVDALTGAKGRNNGLILILFYGVVYFIISRIYKENKIVPLLMCIVSCFVSLTAISQHFYYDNFNLYAGLGGIQIHKFISTLGNRNILSAYLTIVLPVSFMLFIYGKGKLEKLTALASAVISFAGVMCCSSDSSILGASVLAIFCIIFFSGNINRTAQVFFLFGSLLSGCKVLRLFSYFTDDYSMKFGKFQEFFVYGNTYYIIALCFAISIFPALLSVKKPDYKPPKATTYIVTGAFAFIFAFLVVLIIYYTFINTEAKLSGVMSYFRFNNAWGTHRGFMWIKAVYIFIDSNIFQKLLGYGPDTFMQAMDSFGYNDELMAYKNEITDCAHNVYLNYLITIGVFGMASFAAMILSAIVRGIKRAKNNEHIMIFLPAVLCYSVQGLVNIDQPITTPLFILMIAIAESQSRKTKIKFN